MFRLLTALPLVALLFATAPASAAPRPDDKPSGPHIVGQAKSFNELLDMLKAMVKNVGGDAIYKEFEAHMLPDLDPKKLPGIDPKRPFGLYGKVDGKLENCRGVILIPVTSEKDFVDMLENFHIQTVKGKDPGTFDIVVPADFPIPVSVRIYKEYAYVAFGGFDILDTKVILDPKDVINDKEKAALFISIRFDRIPTDAKKALLGILREQVENLKEMIPDADLKDVFASVEKLGMRWLRILAEEGKELAIRIDADPKTGLMFADLTVEGMPKSPLAETFAKRTPTKNAFASLAGDDYAQRLFITAPLFADEAKEALAKLIDYGSKHMIQEASRGNGAPPEILALIEAGFKSLKATVESGDMDLAAAIRGPNKEGFYTAVGAVHCKEGAQLEKALKAAVKVFPEPIKGYFKMDAGKIGDAVVHEIDMSSEAGEIPKKIFGKGQTAYFSFYKDVLYAAYGPDGMKLMKEAMAAKPMPAAVLDSSGDPKKTADLMKKIMPDRPEEDGRLDEEDHAGSGTKRSGARRIVVDGDDVERAEGDGRRRRQAEDSGQLQRWNADAVLRPGSRSGCGNAAATSCGACRKEVTNFGDP
jgi:hypothetical protein